MSSKDVQQYLKKNDMVILPVGCFEMHGPDMPLACDTYIGWAQSILLAKVWNCVTMFPVSYTYPGASGPWPGTVDLPIDLTQDYIRGIVLSLLEKGVKKVVIVGFHGPLSFMLETVVRDIFQETGEIVLFITPDLMPDDLMEKELGYQQGEDIMLLAALRILGLHGAYDPSSKVNRSDDYPMAVHHDFEKNQVKMPWVFSRDFQHTGLRKQVKMDHAEKAVKVMEKAARRLKDVPAHFTKYQKDMEKLFREQPWNKDSVWTKTK